MYQAEPRELSLKNIEKVALFRMTDPVRTLMWSDSQKHLNREQP